jgi:EF-P beta-lysylation protein EpmB
LIQAVQDDSDGKQNGAEELLAGGQPRQILPGNSDFVPTAFESELAANLGGDWQSALKRSIRSSDDLRRILGLPEVAPDEASSMSSSFPTFVPWEFLARIQPGNPDDPLLRQVLHVPEESLDAADFGPDPVGDLNALAADGLLHKYSGRALLITTGACGVHCRYCFRREFPYSEAGSRSDDWAPSLDYLEKNSEIEEVLLSGGDPLTVSDGKLDDLISRLEAIPHLRRLRIHSRMPVVIPQRVTPELVDRLASSRLAVWFVIHANHANELDSAVLSATNQLVSAGIPVLNQAVLLRGVNDSATALIDLCRKLIDHRIQPYYLHQLDRVRGAAHFEVPIAKGNRLIAQIRKALPGYAVPTYVFEQSGQESKTPITDNQ